MSEPYTPTTAEVRLVATGLDDAMTVTHFDRWLAAHDREAAARSVRRAADRLGVNVSDADGEWWDGFRQGQRRQYQVLAEFAAEIERGEWDE